MRYQINAKITPPLPNCEDEAKNAKILLRRFLIRM